MLRNAFPGVGGRHSVLTNGDMVSVLFKILEILLNRVPLCSGGIQSVESLPECLAPGQGLCVPAQMFAGDTGAGFLAIQLV